MTYRISVDTGGTFTDVVVAEESGVFTVGKALTDRDRAFSSIEAGLSVAAAELGTDVEHLLADADLFLYGTTRATNGIIEGKVARTAFLTTQGFPDILLLKEGGKANPHQLQVEYPDPYIPRRDTFEVPERINAEGGVELVLDEEALGATLRQIRARGFEAAAVCLLWSVANPAHELRVGELLEREAPGLPFTLSHQLNPILREYRRASSTAIDASLKPLMQSYLSTLQDDLRKAGYGGDILVSTSFGGVMHLEDIVERPIFLVKSGPAMAPVAGLAYVKAEGLPSDLIVCDAGGTTFDVSLVRDGAIEFTRDTWLGPQWVGHNLGMASVAVHSIGAGGGSIAWVDSGGLLRVGPQSAGSEPGPACYGRGGRSPTVTDAAVVLGYIDPEHFLGGRMQLDRDAAERAISGLAETLRQPLDRSAFAIIAVANENMIQAIKELTINEGIDPSESAIVAGGGAGGLGIVPIAAELGCRQVLVPRTAGALSAAGMQFSDIVSEAGMSRLAVSSDFPFDAINEALEGIEAQLRGFGDTLAGRGFRDVEIRFFVEARYRFQVWELEVPLPIPRFRSAADVEALVEAFHTIHQRVFAVNDPGQAVECLNWRGRLRARVAPPTLRSETTATGVALPARQREAFFGTASVTTPVYRGGELAPGSEIEGPAIIEEETMTLVVHPGARARVSDGGRYLLAPVLESSQ